MREIVLQTKNLSKLYKNFTALDSVDMTVYRGDIYGFIGRNGAGKTTIMKIITGLTQASSGEFEIFSKKGAAVTAQKKRIGCLIENPSFFGNLTAYQNLKYYAIQKGIADMGQIDEALLLVQLSDVKDKKFRKFSLGMKQRLGIALAVLDNSDLIILDEPINGLDPLGISELRNTFKRLNLERGITMIISSHILSELYLVANRFFFIEKGRMLKEITKKELDLECMRCLAVKTDNTKHCAAILEEKLGIRDYKVIDEGELRIYEDHIKTENLNKTLIQNGINISEIFFLYILNFIVNGKAYTGAISHVLAITLKQLPMLLGASSLMTLLGFLTRKAAAFNAIVIPFQILFQVFVNALYIVTKWESVRIFLYRYELQSALSKLVFSTDHAYLITCTCIGLAEIFISTAIGCEIFKKTEIK